jgi:Mrp family chromosome partitioning ATPase
MRPVGLRAKLWLLPCKALQPDSPGLLASGALRKRIAELREEFDFVIINTPPITR